MLETEDNDDSDIEQRRLCVDCVLETFLRAEIERHGENGACHYCDKVSKTRSIGELAEEVDAAFQQHFQLTATEPSGHDYMMMKEFNHDWEREGEPVLYAISSAAEIDEGPAEDIRVILEEKCFDFETAAMGFENPFGEEAYYAEREVNDRIYQEDWRHFEESLKTEARFFSGAVEATLDTVFKDLADHRRADGQTVILEAGPDTDLAALYRARVFQSAGELEDALKRPDLHIRPPPVALARAGRMNAYGISVFYGATEDMVAVSEVRPPVGSRVIVGRFEITRKIKLLDMRALGSVRVEGSVFDPEYILRLERAKFLERLSDLISRPVMPNDEPLEYLVTQVIADYLANRSEPTLDGILYPSVQDGAGGANVMLFHKASLVESIEVPVGTEINVFSDFYSEDGWDNNYYVSEEVPPSNHGEIEDGTGGVLSITKYVANSREPAGLDVGREVTLRLITESLKVHHVSAASYHTDAYSVSRSRAEKREPVF